MGKPTTVDEFIDTLTEPARSRAEELRALCLRCVPDATEAIKWGSPAYVHPSGVILFVLDFFTKHSNVVFTPSTKDAFTAELADFATGKGSVKIPYGESVPGELLERMIHYRIREHVEDGVLWM